MDAVVTLFQRMSYEPGLSITGRERNIFRTVAFSWLCWDSILNSRELDERNRARRPPFYLIRRLHYDLCAVLSAGTVVWSIWHLMSS
jgi:hypothetical protein